MVCQFEQEKQNIWDVGLHHEECHQTNLVFGGMELGVPPSQSSVWGYEQCRSGGWGLAVLIKRQMLVGCQPSKITLWTNWLELWHWWVPIDGLSVWAGITKHLGCQSTPWVPPSQSGVWGVWAVPIKRLGPCSAGRKTNVGRFSTREVERQVSSLWSVGFQQMTLTYRKRQSERGRKVDGRERERGKG